MSESVLSFEERGRLNSKPRPERFMGDAMTGPCFNCGGYVAVIGGGYARLEDWLCRECEKAKLLEEKRQ
jgi:hypothetical protein